MTRILMIEDDAPLREVTVEMLRAEGYEVTEAAGGLAGLAAVQAQIPDLIICDIMMPDLDGHAVLQTLRREPLTATIPFLFLTAKTAWRDQRQAMALGADDYLTKPFTRNELISAIETRRDRFATVIQPLQKRVEDLQRVIARTVPHELRTPLTGILGFATLLKEAQDPLDGDEVREWAGLILTAGERLVRLIERQLLYTNIEALQQSPAQLQLEQSDVTLNADIVIATAARFAAHELDRAADLTVAPIAGDVRSCAEHLAMMTRELVNNACKFSEPGQPILVTGGQTGAEFRLAVRDAGRGMTREQINDMSVYRQFDRRQYEQQGLGLGLALVRNLAHIHGGALHIQSQPAAGTTVEIVLLVPVATV